MTSAKPGERVLNPQVWGSWFEFAVPSVLVAIDSRIEFFPPEVWAAYDTATGGDDQAAQIHAWNVTIVGAPSWDQRLHEPLQQIGWRTAYQDDDGSIMVSPDR